MMSIYFLRFRSFLFFALLQVLVFGHIHILGYATPYLFILFILKLPRFISRNELLLWSFSIGLFVDMFSNTPGMNAAAATLLALVRPNILVLFTPRGQLDDFTPSFRSIGLLFYSGYIILSVLLFCSALFLLELFTLQQPMVLLTGVLSSTLLTLILMVVAESFVGKKQ